MKFKRPKKYDLSINITPLVDVIFLLLIFFVVTAVLENNYLIEIDLPRGIADASQMPLEDIEVVVSHDGRYFVNGVPILNNSETRLQRELQQVSNGNISLPVILYADGEVPHRTVMGIMSIVENTGFTKLQLAVQSKEKFQ